MTAATAFFKASKLKHSVNALGTVVEGPAGKVWNVCRRAVAVGCWPQVMVGTVDVLRFFMGKWSSMNFYGVQNKLFNIVDMLLYNARFKRNDVGLRHLGIAFYHF